MGLVTPEAVNKFTQDNFPGYTEEEKEILSRKYTKEQMAALEAGEAAIDPKDLTIQGRLRTDGHRFRYLDDFATVQPIVDKRMKTKAPADPNAKFMSPDEFADDFVQWLESFIPRDVNIDNLSDEQLKEIVDKHAPSDVDSLRFWLDRPPVTGTGETGNTAMAPALAKGVPGVKGRYKRQTDPEDEGLDETGVYQDVKKHMGLRVRDILQLSTKILVTRWVSNQTRLGKIRSVSVLAIAGNGNGRLGLGSAKSTEPSTAMLKARLQALRNMKPIPRYENRTIYGNIQKKVSGTIVQLASRPPGFGLRVPHRIFEMCRAAGIQDIAARIPRSRSPMNTVKAAYEALLDQPDPEEIAIGRGKKLVDVRKVYYGGAVY